MKKAFLFLSIGLFSVSCAHPTKTSSGAEPDRSIASENPVKSFTDKKKGVTCYYIQTDSFACYTGEHLPCEGRGAHAGTAAISCLKTE